MPGASPRPYAVLDVDGVVADVRHRLHHVQGRRRDWEAFFAGAGDDPVLVEGRAVADELARQHEVVYLSGRPERLRAVTAAWLTDHGLPPGELLLRAEGDRRPGRVVKLAVLRRLAAQRPVAVLVDDDVEVVAAARAAGFAVLDADWARGTAAEQGTLRAVQERDGRT